MTSIRLRIPLAGGARREGPSRTTSTAAPIGCTRPAAQDREAPPRRSRGCDARKPAGRRRRQRAIAPAGPVFHRYRHRLENRPPILPAVEAREIVGAHQPHEADAGETLAQIGEGRGRVGRAERRLEGRDLDAGIAREACAPAGRVRRAGRGWARSLSGLPGVTIHHTCARRSRFSAASLISRCAACGGLKEPPRRPMRIPLRRERRAQIRFRKPQWRGGRTGPVSSFDKLI